VKVLISAWSGRLPGGSGDEADGRRCPHRRRRSGARRPDAITGWTSREVVSTDAHLATAIQRREHHPNVFTAANERPKPPSAGAQQSVPAAVDALVLDCLAKAPGDRPGDALKLIERIDACTGMEPWTGSRAQAWWERHLPASVPLTPPPSTRGDRGDWIRFLKAPVLAYTKGTLSVGSRAFTAAG
jgi:hypothetical protein